MKAILAAATLIWLACAGPALAEVGARDPFFHKKAAPPSKPAKTETPAKSDAAAKPEVPGKSEALLEKAGEKPVTDAGFLSQVSYALGYDIASHLSGQVDLDLAYFLKGIADAGKKNPQLSEDQLRQMLMAYQRLARKKAREEAMAVRDKNLAQGNVFMEGNKLKEGVVTLSSGLQYKVLTEGKGPLPKADSTVECHYRGTLLDGREFDASYTRGHPAVFQVDKVIPGWTQALVRMPVGSKWMLYIPADLAYGDQGAGDIIEPGHTLVFEVELLGILE